jgi:DNA polymerase V
MLALKNVPLMMETVAAGFPSPAEGYVENDIDLNEYLIENKHSTFLVRAGGDSMKNAGIDKGDLLIIDRAQVPKHLDIVIADIGSEFTLKRLHVIDKKIELHAENTNIHYPILKPKPDEKWQIIGVLKWIIKKV